MAGLFDGFEGYRVLGGADVEQALDRALVAVDADVLLNLYRYHARTADDLLAVLQGLGDRLVVPYQAVADFHRDRLAAIGNPEQATRDVREAMSRSAAATARALTTWSRRLALADAEAQRLLDNVEKAFGELSSAVDLAEPDRVHAATPTDEDPVLQRLAEALDGRVLPRPADEQWAALVEEGRRRARSGIPPGHLEADEAQQGGDYLVYAQACAEAGRRGLDLIIVTGAEKDDWWRRHRGVPIGPRPEMATEFFDLTGGRQLFLLRPGDLLRRSASLGVRVSRSSWHDAARDRPRAQWTPRLIGLVLAELGDGTRALLERVAAAGGTSEVSAETVLWETDAGPLALESFDLEMARQSLVQDGRLPDGLEPIATIREDSDGRRVWTMPAEVIGLWGG